MKILLPVDGSPFTQKMLEYVVSATAPFNKEHEFVVMTVVTPLLPQAAGMLGKEAVDDYYRETTDKVLQPALKVLQDKGYKHSGGFKIGYVSEALPEEATEGGYGLVVMGSHGHGALGNLVLGSVANAMLSKTKIPVLLIR